MRLSSTIIFAAFALWASASPIDGYNSRRSNSLWRRIDGGHQQAAGSSITLGNHNTPQGSGSSTTPANHNTPGPQAPANHDTPQASESHNTPQAPANHDTPQAGSSTTPVGHNAQQAGTPSGEPRMETFNDPDGSHGTIHSLSDGTRVRRRFGPQPGELRISVAAPHSESWEQVYSWDTHGRQRAIRTGYWYIIHGQMQVQIVLGEDRRPVRVIVALTEGRGRQTVNYAGIT